MREKKKETTSVDLKKDLNQTPVNTPNKLLSDFDVHLFNEGNHFSLYEKLGSKPLTKDGKKGTHFAVWAPNAHMVFVMGDFNGWNKHEFALSPSGNSGIWEGFVPGVTKGQVYKYHIESKEHAYKVDKADPFALFTEVPPKTGSIVWDLDYEWGDENWMKERANKNSLSAPQSIYELHIGSWMRVPEDGNRSLTYRELAEKLTNYILETGFTHVEFMPVMEHPFYGSWGYQVTSFFAPTSRFGTPQDFMYLIDHLHQNGIGVILDWVPSHFPTDEFALGYFDGTHLFEHADPRQGIHPDWESFIFNYSRNEVRCFLISNALFWLEKYHADGLRIDAVASMLYLDYSREEGEWIPNKYGGRENLEAISLLRQLNEEVYKAFPDIQTTAEESTDWPMVSRPVYVGGLGFGMKWDMGWMHDTLKYMEHNPIHRKYHHHEMTFRMLYAFNENFVLPLSHDEVVHGKGSLLAKMPGDDWQKFANLRILFSYMYAQPGKKLLFMGAEIGQWKEWSHEGSLEWDLLQYGPHAGIKNLVTDLNRLYKENKALHELDCVPHGFEWVDANDADNSVFSFVRSDKKRDQLVTVVFNCTPIPRENYRLGVERKGVWKEILNTDSEYYGGSGIGNLGGVEAESVSFHGRPWSLNIAIPPLAAVFFKWDKE